MRLITLVFYQYIAACAAQRDRGNGQDRQLSSNSTGKYKVRRYIGSHVATSDLNEDYTQPATSRSGPVTKDVDLFDDNFKGCLMQSSIISILFEHDDVLCDGFRKLTKRAQLDLVDRSKNYVLAYFGLPTRKEILDMIQLQDNQFNSTLLRKLKQAGVDPRKASKQGKRFVQNCLIKSGSGVLESILHYYWSSVPFRNEFLDRMFKALASTLTTQEYFELESLLDWIHSDYYVMDEKDYDKLKDIIKRHYKVPWHSPKYWSAWYSMRPLEGDNRPVPKPIFNPYY